jgi:hypothetical protein
MDITAIISATTPEAIREVMKPATEAVTNSTILMALMCAFVLLFLLGIYHLYSYALSERKSYEYRKLMTDMYVVGTVKKLAGEDGINLEDEFKEFKKWDKKQKNKDKDLDATIESSIQDKVTEKKEIAIEKLNEFQV